jgi:hypothetical protein
VIGRSDLIQRARPIMMSREGAARLDDRTQEDSCNRTRRACVRSRMMYAKVSLMSEAVRTGCCNTSGHLPGALVSFSVLWIIFGNDRTSLGGPSGGASGASGHDLNLECTNY